MKNFIFNKLAETPISPGQLPQSSVDQSTVTTILNLAFETLGALALLMIVISGFRYVIAGNNPENTKKARNGIVYALVGLIIAVLARAIVTYVGNNI